MFYDFIKYFYFQENTDIRATSIRLYGELCLKTKDFNIEVDMSLHHNNMVTFLMHLCENDKNIVQVSIELCVSNNFFIFNVKTVNIY